MIPAIITPLGTKPSKRLGYDALRAEQAERVEAFKRGETRKLIGIGLSHFTEIVGAGPVKNCDILGMGMFDSCEIRIHPTGSAIARSGHHQSGSGSRYDFCTDLGQRNWTARRQHHR